MKIDLQSIDRTQFYVNEHLINGELCYLVIPVLMGCNWSKDNIHFRSSVWNYDGELISASFPKFFNWGEKPDLSPLPKDLNGSKLLEKIDGSTIIISKYRGNFIIRSRGTVDAFALTTGAEMALLKEKHPVLFKMDEHKETWDFSVVTEYVSPNNQIVIRYNEVEFYLTAVIDHKDYSLMAQSDLDNIAHLLTMKRPQKFTFASVDDLLASVEQWQDKEGVVLYCNKDQQLMKIKAARYLLLHHMKSELSSLEKVLDVWISQGYPSYQDFYDYIVTTFDYELAESCRGHISNICDGYKEVKKIVEHMTNFVEPLKKLPRKDAAMKILGAYGETNRKAFAFTLLDGKPIDDDGIKKLIFQVLKK